eukprot:scaffold5498_cov86-Cylindrotheca_fusiformis.AAC.5
MLLEAVTHFSLVQQQQLFYSDGSNRMAVSTSEILLEVVCPALGVVIANCMLFAPYGDLKKAIQKGQLGDLNPTPWAFMLGNCFGWIFYALLKGNLWVLASNGPGFIFSIWLNFVAVKLLQQEHYTTELRNHLILNEQQVNSFQNGSTQPFIPKVEKEDTNTANADWSKIVWDVTSQEMTPAPTRHETLVLALTIVWTIAGSIVALAMDELILSKEAVQLIVGVLTNMILVFFYAAPLSSIKTVLRDRNTVSLHVPTMMLNTLNSSFWMVYGLGVGDYFIILPNGLGACLGAFQVVLCLIFPRGTITAPPVKIDAVDPIGTTTVPPVKIDAANYCHANSIGSNGTAETLSMESLEDLVTRPTGTDEESQLLGGGSGEKTQTYCTISC